VLELLGAQTARQKEEQGRKEELLELLDKPTARQALQTEKFRTQV